MRLHRRGDLFRMLPDHLQIGADDPDRDRRQRAEAHDVGHDIARLETEARRLACCSASAGDNPPCLQPLRQPGNHPLGKNLAQPLAKLDELDPAIFAQGDADLAIVRPAHEEHHVVDAEIGGDLTHVTHRDLDVLGLRLVFDLLQAFHRHLPGQLEIRAGRRPEPEHELPGIDLGEQLGAYLEPQLPENEGTCAEVERDHQPALAYEQAHDLAVAPQHAIKQARLASSPCPCPPPWCFNRATQRIGTNVLESRYDAIMANPTPRVSGMNSDRSGSSMMNAGMNTDKMHKQRQ